MNGPIKVGDLAIIIKPKTCCGYTGGIGEIFTVTGFFDHSNCSQCGAHNTYPVALKNGKWLAVDLKRIKRIPPFPELADEKTDDRIPELVLK